MAAAADPSPQYVWYLAYGSNMNPSVLTGRRRVQPVESFPCRVPAYKLDSYVRGYPYIEPAFFSISKRTSADPEPELHGVAHKITAKDYQQIRATEGGGGHPTLGYQDEHLKVYPALRASYKRAHVSPVCRFIFYVALTTLKVLG